MKWTLPSTPTLSLAERDRDLLKMLGANTLEKYEENFTIEHTIASVVSLYITE